jgi:hypothetical protein
MHVHITKNLQDTVAENSRRLETFPRFVSRATDALVLNTFVYAVYYRFRLPPSVYFTLVMFHILRMHLRKVSSPCYIGQKLATVVVSLRRESLESIETFPITVGLAPGVTLVFAVEYHWISIT